MEPATWGFFGTLLGAIVGASASVLATLITTRNARKLNQDEASFERKERAREFQLKNYYELQNALSFAVRLAMRAHLEDIESFQENKTTGEPVLLSDQLDQELLESNRQLSILTERILEDALRERVKAFRGEMVEVLLAKDDSGSRLAMEQVSSSFEEIMQDIGLQLRICAENRE